MNISKKDSLKLFRFLAKSKNKDDLYLKYENLILSTLFQIEKSVENEQNKLIKNIKTIKEVNGRTLYVGDNKKFPKGCLSCLCGDGLNSIRKTNVCNLECKFCYYYGELDRQKKIPDNMWKIGENLYREQDIENLIRIQGKPSGISYAYLEPFVEIEKYFGIIKKFNSAGVHQHLYTNGTLADEESLKELGSAGLDEIRFNLGASKCSDEVISKIKIAKKYIPRVGIETPMTNEFFKLFIDKKTQIMDTGLDFINCAELHLNPNNIENFEGEKLYICRKGYVSPVWSRLLTLKLMKIAADEKWNFVVHDCSNVTKYNRELNYGKNLNLWFGANYYGLEFQRIPYSKLIPILEGDDFNFIDEEKLPVEMKIWENK